jgi:hypothetical protein
MFRRYAITDAQEMADNLGKPSAYRTAPGTRKQFPEIGMPERLPPKNVPQNHSQQECVTQ